MQLVPDLALRDPGRERLRRLRLRLAPAELRVGDAPASLELRRDVPPSPLLHAGHGDREHRLRLDEDAHVQDAVLLRAHELLAVVEEDALGERVLDGELGHAARLARLADAQAGCERLVEREVRGNRVVSREERCDDDPAVLRRLADLEAVLDR